MTTTRGNELLNTNYSRCNDVALQASLRDLAARCARGLHESFGPIEQRAQGKPGAQCTRSLVCKKQTHERSHHRFTGNSPAFPAQWFYGLLRALPGDHALLTPSPALLLADLTPALGRQNDTTWPYASASFVRLALARLTPPRPPHPAPRFVTCATPLLWAGTVRICI
jgi:hypothetical protein